VAHNLAYVTADINTNRKYTSDQLIYATTTADKMKILCFLLGNFPASEFYMPTFRILIRVMNNWVDRLHRCLAQKGAHIEHLM